MTQRLENALADECPFMRWVPENGGAGLGSPVTAEGLPRFCERPPQIFVHAGIDEETGEGWPSIAFSTYYVNCHRLISALTGKFAVISFEELHQCLQKRVHTVFRFLQERQCIFCLLAVY